MLPLNLTATVSAINAAFALFIRHGVNVI